MTACEETGTVVCLHVGSSSTIPETSPEAPPDTIGVLFFGYAMFYAVDWLYSMIPVRHPDLKICFSEGGIGWVAGLLDRLDHILRYHELYGTWKGIELTPAEVVRRNFWFCAIDDPSGFLQVDRIGAENLLVESDYPHLDSTWPDTQPLLHGHLAHLPDDIVRKITWANASELFRHEVPERVQHDPSAY
jgi:predicted TIM-barrel fold metal-dependent hydrolase